MTFYILFYVVIMLLTIIELQQNKPFKNIIYYILFAIISLFVACRIDVGSDWNSYKSFYYSGIAYDKISGEFEPCFSLIRNVIFSLGLKHGVFFWVLSFISLLLIKKTSQVFAIEKFMLVFFCYLGLFFCNYQFNIIRHGLMASFVWLALAYNSEGKIKKSYFLILLSMGFHILGGIAFFIMFLIDKKYNRKKIIIAIMASLICVYLGLSKTILVSIPILSDLERIASYINRADYEENYGLTLGTIFNLCIFIYAYFKYNNTYYYDKKYTIVVNTVLLSFIFLCFLNAFSAIISRLCNMLNISIIFLLPMLYNKIKNKNEKIVCFILISIYVYFYYVKSFTVTSEHTGTYTMLPYVFNLNQIF